MSQFTVIFTFVGNSNQGLSAALRFNGTTTIILSGENTIQIQGEGGPIPPLNSFNVGASMIAFEAPLEVGTQPALRVLVSVNCNDVNLTGSYSSNGMPASLSYQFLGFPLNGPIPVGDFSLTLPSDGAAHG
jgi:hypothetical protein